MAPDASTVGTASSQIDFSRSASSQIDFSRFQGHGNAVVNEQAQQVARKMRDVMASEGGLLGLALGGKGGGGIESLMSAGITGGMSGGSLSGSVMGMGSSASNSASVMGLVSALTGTGGSMEKDSEAKRDDDGDRKEDKRKDRGDKKEREPKEVSLSPARALLTPGTSSPQL